MTQVFGGFAAANRRSPRTIGTVLSRLPWIISSGCCTRLILSIDAKRSSLDSAITPATLLSSEAMSGKLVNADSRISPA